MKTREKEDKRKGKKMKERQRRKKGRERKREGKEKRTRKWQRRRIIYWTVMQGNKKSESLTERRRENNSNLQKKL